MSSNKYLFIWDDRTVSHDEFDGLLSSQESLFSKHRRVMVRCSDTLELSVALILARDLDRELFLCHSFFEPSAIDELAAKHNVDLVLFDGWMSNRLDSIKTYPSRATGDTGGNLFVFTSGTTGTAKIARHRWASIQHSASFVAGRLKDRTWLMSYSPTSYAGLQVFFSAFNNSGTLYFPPADYDGIASGIQKQNVEIISATPTYWRLLISSWPPDLSPVKLHQATLGGEVVDQSILDQIKSFFDPEKLTHIYASTEAGTAIVTSDGIAGFPVAYLDRTEGVRLRIVDDGLQVQSPAPMAEYLGGKTLLTDDGWLMTGDIVEVKDGRVYFAGREDGMINVGGLKVSPDEVESAMHTLEEVIDCRVFGKKSPLVGSMVIAEVVLSEGSGIDARSMKERLRDRLADYKVPQIFIPVPKIEATPHGKKSRQ